MEITAKILCSCCGAIHEDDSELTYIGATDFGDGAALHQYNCECGSTLGVWGPSESAENV